MIVVVCVATPVLAHAAGKKPLLETLDELHVSSLSDDAQAQPDTPDASASLVCHSCGRVDTAAACLPGSAGHAYIARHHEGQAREAGVPR